MEESSCQSVPRWPLVHPQNMHTLSGSMYAACRGRSGLSVGAPLSVSLRGAAASGAGGCAAVALPPPWRALASGAGRLFGSAAAAACAPGRAWKAPATTHRQLLCSASHVSRTAAP